MSARPDLSTPPAEDFIQDLIALASKAEIPKVERFFKGGDQAKDNRILGVPIGKVFPVAARHASLTLGEIESLLDDARYEVRVGAVAIMDFQARAKSTSAALRKALFDLYLRRHDRINNWDLVDRAAPHVVGGYLLDKPRTPLTKLAKSTNPWERRSAIVATWAFIRVGETAETFRIAGLLAADPHEFVQKAVGSWVREAGKRDPKGLVGFLEAHRGLLPRATLRAAAENLSKATIARLLGARPPAARRASSKR